MGFPAAIATLALALLVGPRFSPGAAAISLWESQFSTSEFGHLPYKGLTTVSIFQHLTKVSTFYINPLVLLDHRSGSLRHNALTELYELRFKVIMWDSELLESVKTYLTTKKSVVQPEVKMLPMEKVRFQWTSRSRKIRKDVTMETEFIATHHLPRYLTLTFACKSKLPCEGLQRQVQRGPEALDSLVIDCFMSAKKSATKTIKVSVDNLMKTKTFSKLIALPPDGNFLYMRNEDLNNLAQEAFSSVSAETIRTSEYVDSQDELRVMNLLERAMKQDEIYSNSLVESQWESVFWDPAYARPDRVVREAQSTFRKKAGTNQMEVNKDHLESNSNARQLFDKKGFGVDFGYNFQASKENSLSGKPSLSLKSDRESTDDSSSSKSDQKAFSSRQLNDWFQEENLNVLWDGEKFVVKPMRLARINQREFRSRRELVSHNMLLTVYQQVIQLKVIIKATHNQTWLSMESSRPGGFPTEFSYCLLSNGGSCPPGFRRSSGFLKAIHMDTSSPGMIQNAQLGDSAIKCHSPGDSDNCDFKGWEPFKGELHLHVCCR